MLNFLKLIIKAFFPRNPINIMIFFIICVIGISIYRVIINTKEFFEPVPIEPEVIKSLKDKPMENFVSDVLVLDESERLSINKIDTIRNPVIVPHSFLPNPHNNEEIIICRTYNGQECLPTKRNGKVIHYRTLVENLKFKYINNRVILIDPLPNKVNISYLVLYVSNKPILHDNKFPVVNLDDGKTNDQHHELINNENKENENGK